MLPVLTAEQVRRVDALTTEREPIRSTDLMERAALAFTKAFLEVLGSAPRPVLVICGPGNNGGDGLAIARHLAARKWPVRAFCPYDPVGSSLDNVINRKRLKEVQVDVLSGSDRALPAFRSGELVIDALFGTGLTRPLTGHYLHLVRELNARKGAVVAVDLPSGAFVDGGPEDRSAIVHARWTCTFQVPKPFMLLPGSMGHCGEWRVVDIGLDRDAVASCGSLHFLLEATDIDAILPERPRAAHKGRFGHAMLMAGGTGHLGAAIMATAAAARSGAGLVTVTVPRQMGMALHSAVPEAMVLELGDGDHLGGTPPSGRWSAVGIGPGIGLHHETALLLKNVLRTTSWPLVLDADALNILAGSPDLLELLPPGSVLTPHPGEADRLFGPAMDTRDRIAKSSSFAQKRRGVVVLKGANTAICLADGRVLYNATGNVGMAKGGTGDVLTGLITGLLAQGLSPSDAAIVGVWIHGLAGDIAAEERGADGMTAMDVVGALPDAFRRHRGATSVDCQ
ncbi:MAG: NAD(P)H-hydrate dehydratase [Flavobacteriales bacterium]|nr:NAD(P)H-hydrate dehydratase [Flavobacteriales bacterium]